MKSELERTVDYLHASAARHRKTLFWLFFLLFLAVLIIAVREVAALLLAAYGLAVLLDPVVSWLERRRINRGLAVVLLGLAAVLLVAGLLILAIPALIREYQELIRYLPDYVRTSAERIDSWLNDWFGLRLPHDINELVNEARESIAALGVDHLKTFAKTVGGTMLRGYSVALTLLNLFLLPFFVFYITRDYRQLHRFLGSFLTKEHRWKVRQIGGEILGHIYAFFRGQLTVCLVLAVLYVVGLTLVGMPSALIVGTLTGLLNIVPYLGVGLGLLLSAVITLVSDPSLVQFMLVLGVFGVVQLLEGSFITPKIVGESMGIHPLGVMLALIVGGQLFGLLGLILAIPAAAAVRVLFRHVLSAIDRLETEDADRAEALQAPGPVASSPKPESGR